MKHQFLNNRQRELGDIQETPTASTTTNFDQHELPAGETTETTPATPSQQIDDGLAPQVQNEGGTQEQTELGPQPSVTIEEQLASGDLTITKNFPALTSESAEPLPGRKALVEDENGVHKVRTFNPSDESDRRTWKKWWYI